MEHRDKADINKKGYHRLQASHASSFCTLELEYGFSLSWMDGMIPTHVQNAHTYTNTVQRDSGLCLNYGRLAMNGLAWKRDLNKANLPKLLLVRKITHIPFLTWGSQIFSSWLLTHVDLCSLISSLTILLSGHSCRLDDREIFYHP